MTTHCRASLLNNAIMSLHDDDKSERERGMEVFDDFRHGIIYIVFRDLEKM